MFFCLSLSAMTANSTQRTVWELPDLLHPDTNVSLSYHAGKSWSRNGNKTILKSASQGQEFIFTEDKNGAAERWAVGLIHANGIADE